MPSPQSAAINIHDGANGASYFILTVAVPALLILHALVFIFVFLAETEVPGRKLDKLSSAQLNRSTAKLVFKPAAE